MSLLLLMLPFMLALGGAFLGLFLWAVEARQYEAPEDEKYRIFFEDDGPSPGRGMSGGCATPSSPPSSSRARPRPPAGS